MKLLLTSAGIKNASIYEELVNLLGKPIADSSALCIPTAIYAFPGGAVSAWQLITGRAASPLCGTVEIVSEGLWRVFTPDADGPHR